MRNCCFQGSGARQGGPGESASSQRGEQAPSTACVARVTPSTRPYPPPPVRRFIRKCREKRAGKRSVRYLLMNCSSNGLSCGLNWSLPGGWEMSRELPGVGTGRSHGRFVYPTKKSKKSPENSHLESSKTSGQDSPLAGGTKLQILKYLF